MTLKELQELLNSESKSNENLEVKVWLPGSTIRLSGQETMIRRGNILMVEGNVDPGSALDRG